MLYERAVTSSARALASVLPHLDTHTPQQSDPIVPIDDVDACRTSLDAILGSGRVGKLMKSSVGSTSALAKAALYELLSQAFKHCSEVCGRQWFKF